MVRRVDGFAADRRIVALIYAYLVRFMAMALQTAEAGWRKSHPYGRPARSLGRTSFGVVRDVQVPIISGSLFTAALIVFVEAMKELPATLILRPFNYDTLAIVAHNLAADERLLQSAGPSLMIVIAGLLPLIIISLRIARSRAGSGREWRVHHRRPARSPDLLTP